ncbi:hypothetical protein SEVIR_9G236655v4 [Setaria viridis]
MDLSLPLDRGRSRAFLPGLQRSLHVAGRLGSIRQLCLLLLRPSGVRPRQCPQFHPAWDLQSHHPHLHWTRIVVFSFQEACACDAAVKGENRHDLDGAHIALRPPQ